MAYTLLVTRGPDEGLRYPIRARQVSVGRASDMHLVLTDPTIKPRHFQVTFDEGGWRAITYDESATILIDRRWQHPRSRQRGARIFAGNTQLILYAGEDVDLETARRGSEGLDIDEETLRDDALTTVGNEELEFRHDMTGKATRVGDRKQRPGDRRRPAPAPRSRLAEEETQPPAPPSRRPVQAREVTPTEAIVAKPPPPAASTASGRRDGTVFDRGAGMMRLPATIEEGRRARPENVKPPPNARTNAWEAGRPEPAHESVPRSRALQKGQTITLTDTAIQAMPSSSRDLWVLYDKDGPFASELRILATRLEDMKGTFGYKTFLFTSVDAGDGKTVVAANLALVMSEDPERKIALVDANFRSPRAGGLFNLDQERGLLSAIAGERQLSECVARVVGRNLIVLSAGGQHKNPAQVLSDPRFKSLLAELAQHVDYMLIDAPSAVPYADVPLLAQHVDAIFMVVRSAGTKVVPLVKAVETVGKQRVVGTVFVGAHKGRRKKRKEAAES